MHREQLPRRTAQNKAAVRRGICEELLASDFGTRDKATGKCLALLVICCVRKKQGRDKTILSLHCRARSVIPISWCQESQIAGISNGER